MKTKEENGKLILFPAGRIDANNASDFERELTDAVSANGGMEPILDAGELKYISSAGLRVLMRLRKALGKDVTIRNVSPEVYDIFDMTGFTSLLKVEKAMRFVSVAGLELLGGGVHSTVYRLDDESIIKVVKDMTLEAIRAEMQVSKTALIHGIPTAISYDVVNTEEGYGEVYEMFSAGVLSAAVMAEPERREEYLRRFVDMYREIHDVEIGEGELASVKDRYYEAAEALAPLIGGEELKRVFKLIDAVPEKNGFVHGDFHMNNVMLQSEELLLIDVGEAGYGHPLFDFAQTAWAYEFATVLRPDMCRKVTGMALEEAAFVRDGVFREYFAGEDEKYLANKLAAVHGMAMLRRLLIPFLQGWDEAEAKARERLPAVGAQLFPQIDGLCGLIRSEF